MVVSEEDGKGSDGKREGSLLKSENQTSLMPFVFTRNRYADICHGCEIVDHDKFLSMRRLLIICIIHNISQVLKASKTE